MRCRHRRRGTCDAAAVSQGRRPAPRRRSRARRPAHRRRSPVPLSASGTKTAAGSSRSRRSSPGRRASVAGRVLSCGLRSTRRPGFKIFEALVGDDSGAAARDLAQPAVSARRLHRRAARRALRRRRDARRRRPAAHQSAVRDPRRGGGRDDSHRPHRAGVREEPARVTPKMQRRLVHDALQRLPADLPDHAARGAARCACSCRRGTRRSSRRTFRRPTRRSRS